MLVLAMAAMIKRLANCCGQLQLLASVGSYSNGDHGSHYVAQELLVNNTDVG